MFVTVLSGPGCDDVAKVDNRVGGPPLHLAIGPLLGQAGGGADHVAADVPQEDVHRRAGHRGTPGAVGSGEGNVNARFGQRDFPAQVSLDRLVNELDQSRAPEISERSQLAGINRPPR